MLENNAFSGALRCKSYPTLPCVTSLLDSFCLGTFRYGFIMLPPCVFARLLVGNYKGNFCRTHFWRKVYNEYCSDHYYVQFCARLWKLQKLDPTKIVRHTFGLKRLRSMQYRPGGSYLGQFCWLCAAGSLTNPTPLKSINFVANNCPTVSDFYANVIFAIPTCSLSVLRLPHTAF